MTRSIADRAALLTVSTDLGHGIAVIASLTVDDEGRLWVGRTVAPGTYPQFDLFTRDGHYLGSVEFTFEPAGFLPFRVRHGRVYAIVRDDLDVPFVVRTAPVGL